MAEVAEDRSLAVVERASPAGGALRMDAPVPGSYWRLRKEVVGDEDEARVRADEMEAGTVLMLQSVEMADGQPHVYVFAPHPEWIDGDKQRFHADDFYAWWEPAPDGESVRAHELEKLYLAMEETKQAMLAPPPEAVPVALLAHDPTAQIGEEGKALATRSQVKSILAHAERLREDAEQRAQWIQTHSETLSEQGQVLANFHQERAQAALARTQAQIEGVEGILKTVANLHLYTGKGVEVMQLRGGAPASPDARLTIYQEVLALDEEALILLDQGGLDHTRTEELIEALADPALLNRLIPAERGIVLVQFRNSYKEFIKARGDNGDAVARYNHQMSRESQRKRLLVRDGERLWLIDADEVLAQIKQLMPSQAEQDAYFLKDRWEREPRRITREDMDYARAQRAQLFALDHYGQVLIVLWGLHDRKGLFEKAQIPRFSNWLDPAFQDCYLQLVSSDSLIGVERPNFATWQAEQNATLASSVTVAVDLNQAMDEVSAPGAFSSGRWTGRDTYYETVYEPELPKGMGNVLIAEVRRDAKGLFVDVPCKYAGYRHQVRRQTANIKLYLRYVDPAARLVDGVLVLDRVFAADLTYYLESRQQRRSYSSYVGLFRAARRWAAERDAREAPLRAQLRAAAEAGGLKLDPDRREVMLVDAIAVARAARRDRTIPEVDTPAFKAFLRAAMDALYAASSNHDARVAAIDTWAAQRGRQPLRLVLTGRGDWKLYLVPTAAEHDDRLGAPAHATVARVEFDGAGATVVPNGRQLLRPATGEQVVHDWEREPDGAAQWLAKAPGFLMTYQRASALMDLPARHVDALAAMDPAELVERSVRYMRKHSKGSVSRMSLGVVIATGLARAHGRENPVLLVAQTDALRYAYAHGNAEVRARCNKAIRDIYANPRPIEGEIELEWDVVEAQLQAMAKCADEPWFQHYVRGYGVDPAKCERRGNAGKRGERLRVTKLSPLGARLVPWLIDFTHAATD